MELEKEMFKATGTLKKLGTRDGHIFFLHRWHGIPIPELQKTYERKHYYVLKVRDGLTVPLIPILSNFFFYSKWKYNKHLLTFTELKDKKFPTQGDNYTDLQPDQYIGKMVKVTALTPVEHTHYGLTPEYYPATIEEA